MMAEHSLDTVLVPAQPVQESSPARRIGRVSLRQVVIAAVLAEALVSVPWWDILYGKLLNEDLDNYLQYAAFASARLDRLLGEDPMTFFLNEPLWLVLNSLFSDAGLSTDALLSTCAYVCWFGTALFFLAQRVPPWFFFFLLNPYIIDLTAIHQRQGLAVGLLLVGDTLALPGLLLTCIASPLIHTSSALIIGSWLYREVTRPLTQLRWQAVLVLLAFVIFGYQIVNFFFANIGDSRSQYSVLRTDSGLYAVPWLICTVALLFEHEQRAKAWNGSAYVVFAVSAFAMTSGGAFRMVEGAFPFLVTASSTLTRWRRAVVVGSLVIFQFVQYIYKYTYMYTQ